jgi:hypothetical protein
VSFPLEGPIAGMIVAALALLFLGLAVWMYWRQRSFLERSVTTVGVVHEVVEAKLRSRDDDKPTTYFYPRVKFMTAAGKEIQFESDDGDMRRTHYHKGQQLAVLYDPARPDRAQLTESVSERSFIPLFPAGFGVVLALMAFVILGASGPLVRINALTRWFVPFVGVGLVSAVAFRYWLSGDRTANDAGFVAALAFMASMFVVLGSRLLFGVPSW